MEDMRKIMSVFRRNYQHEGGDGLVRDEVSPGAEWVLAGEGIATRKYDGTAVKLRNGLVLKRYDARHGKRPPHEFEPVEASPDPITGHWPGWVPAILPTDKWIYAAMRNAGYYLDGTYEAIGPHFTGRGAVNPEHLAEDILVPHGAMVIADCPRTYEALREYLRPLDIEGIVFHHVDGRMAKIKKTDFGMVR